MGLPEIEAPQMQQQAHQDTVTADAPAAKAQTNEIFALDIGTRSVIGIVGMQEDDTFRVLDMQRMEHVKRAMVDGQIEDIDQVAKVAGAVKKRLEESLSISLKHVCVAAAGRTLVTQKAAYETEFDGKDKITVQQVLEMEAQAVQQAHAAVVEREGGGAEFFCVGYSVIRYYLDDYAISTLIDHRGRRARAEIIATFLPNEVVESLYTVMSKIGLTVASLTLEPIAAMNAVIPQELRLLNLALVDIGAGTSDIAISNGGSVVAYTMATVAGDEITEAIVREYLVDFETAERIKLELGKKGGRIEYKDILGFRYSVTTDELLDRIRPVVDSLCGVICDKIMEVNEKAPAAVFLVGGGSQLPFLCPAVAQKLRIEENKVAVGGNNYMKRMVEANSDISGPEYATPMGIALTALLSREHGSFTVTVNGAKVQLYKNENSVMDILLNSGYQHSQIIGRSGRSVTYELNHEKKVVRGGFPTAAEIEVNGKRAIISTPVRPGDTIVVKPAEPGADAQPVIEDAVSRWEPIVVLLNGMEVRAGTVAVINGAPADSGQKIQNLDIVEVHDVTTLSDLCREAKIDMAGYKFLVNGREQAGGYTLAAQDDIRYFTAASVPVADEWEASSPGGLESEPGDGDTEDIEDTEEAFSGGKQQDAPPEPAGDGGSDSWKEAYSAVDVLTERVRTALPLRVALNQHQVELYPKDDGAPYQFVDMLNFVDIDPSKPQGNIALKLNGADASYLDEIHDGDQIEIFWDSFGIPGKV